MKFILYRVCLIYLFLAYSLNAQSYYFPPVGSDSWEKITIEELGWDQSKIESLIDFLNEKNSKAFILLKDGKIVIEEYFGSFTKDSLWYWASAGKTLTSALVGIAQQEGLLTISDKTSKYLGEGWTSMEKDKEGLITINHQLSMTTGLDYKVDDLDCTKPECLKYKADAGKQWYYHNAPYTLLEQVVEKASGTNYNLYFAQKIRNQIGMNGMWIKLAYNNIYFSNARSMARFGILTANNGFWEDKNVIKDKDYINQMVNTSQDLNKSYGYLWWLNGKESSMIPGSSLVFNMMLMQDAPNDVYAALGKDGQCLNISPGKGLIWVRMGERPDDQFFISTNFSNEVWKYINQITKSTNIIEDYNVNLLSISPNPAEEYILITGFNKGGNSFDAGDAMIYNVLGESVNLTPALSTREGARIYISGLPAGVYFVRIGEWTGSFVKVGY